ncbi:hypothetical protein ACWGCK_10995 [Streptomyces virginiae]|uniref:hypothetical protein n=1 Tax=Streptomyces virginiae TaxID=1961 RepID=UPI0036878E91
MVAASPGIVRLHTFARSAQEARELAAVIPEGRITDLDLPEHEQLTMCCRRPLDPLLLKSRRRLLC